jgi:hypothetical protein
VRLSLRLEGATGGSGGGGQHGKVVGQAERLSGLQRAPPPMARPGTKTGPGLTGLTGLTPPRTPPLSPHPSARIAPRTRRLGARPLDDPNWAGRAPPSTRDESSIGRGSSALLFGVFFWASPPTQRADSSGTVRVAPKSSQKWPAFLSSGTGCTRLSPFLLNLRRSPSLWWQWVRGVGARAVGRTFALSRLSRLGGGAPKRCVGAPRGEVEGRPDLHARGRVGQARKEPDLRPLYLGDVGERAHRHGDAPAQHRLAANGLRRHHTADDICDTKDRAVSDPHAAVNEVARRA